MRAEVGEIELASRRRMILRIGKARRANCRQRNLNWLIMASPFVPFQLKGFLNDVKGSKVTLTLLFLGVVFHIELLAGFQANS